jgi:hypothetical protein
MKGRNYGESQWTQWRYFVSGGAKMAAGDFCFVSAAALTSRAWASAKSGL